MKSLYEGEKTSVRVNSELSVEFVVKVGNAPRTSAVIFFFAVVVDVTEFYRKGAHNELLYTDDIVLMCGTIEGLRNKFLKW